MPQPWPQSRSFLSTGSSELSTSQQTQGHEWTVQLGLWVFLLKARVMQSCHQITRYSFSFSSGRLFQSLFREGTSLSVQWLSSEGPEKLMCTGVPRGGTRCSLHQGIHENRDASVLIHQHRPRIVLAVTHAKKSHARCVSDTWHCLETDSGSRGRDPREGAGVVLSDTPRRSRRRGGLQEGRRQSTLSTGTSQPSSRSLVLH